MWAVWTVFKHTGIQFFAFFGVFVIGGALLTLLSRWTNNVFKQFVFPNFGMYAFGIIGVPFHELCHAFFCKLFLHEVTSVKWFDAQGKGGSHGAVEHLYDPWNLYHRIGHFFIGLGPVLLSPLLLAVLFYVLVPDARPVLKSTLAGWDGMLAIAKGFYGVLVAKKTLTSPGFYLFIYLAVSISSQMELSREDLKQAAQGVLPLLFLILIVNTVAALFNFKIHGPLERTGFTVFAIGACFFLLAGLLATFNLALCTALMAGINKICGREGINPFRA